MTEEFRVPKEKQPVTVRLKGGAKLDGVIFLEQFPYDMTTYRKVSALLEDESQFFPLLLNASGSVEFINKNNITVLECDYHAGEGNEEFLLTQMHIENIVATLNDGSAISGRLMAEVPEDKARLSDCLNLRNTFMILQEDNRIFYLNKNTVQRVVYKNPK